MRSAKPAVRGQAVDLRRQAQLAPIADRRGGESVANLANNTAIYTGARRAGTALAIIPIVIGGAAFSAKRGRNGWGGARNSASRTSDALTEKQSKEIIAASQFAARVGLPLNRHLTIHWEAAGVTDCGAAAATAAFLALARDWLRKRGAASAWVWVRENGDNKGSHVHILVHCRPELARAFSAMQRRWLRRVTGNPYRARVIRTARIGGTLTAAQMAPAHYAENLAAVVAYLLKGATLAAARELGLQRLEAGGRIIGKRAGTSQNIGRATRSRFAKVAKSGETAFDPLRTLAPNRIASLRITLLIRSIG
jgi:hypothetical protein